MRKTQQTPKSDNSFLEADYQLPSTSNYAKLKDGENKIRILSKPVVGYLDWKDNKPLRFRMDNKPKAPIDPKRSVKHFWAFPIYNYNEKSVQILELTQSSIQKAIQALTQDEDWANVFEYDIKIVREGSGMETEYTVNPVPHKPVSEEIKKAYFDKGEINLDALFEGGDPFKS